MFTEKLKKIDKRLIELLQERNYLINCNQSQSFCNEEQMGKELTTDFDLLSAFNIPKETWEQLTIVTNNIVNSINGVKPVNEQRPITVNKKISYRVTIVGGKGRMGQFFAEQLAQAGHHVQILGRQDWEQADLLLSKTDLVLISVPIEQTSDIIEQTCQYIAPTTAIADLTSIKTEPIAKMLASHSGAVMGLHPMFGPNHNSFATQKIVVCPGRHDRAFQWLIDFMKSQGGELIFCQPQEHDRAMAVVQAVRHFSQFGFGIFLTSDRVDLDGTLSMASPNYRLEYEAVKRFFQQNPSMYVDIMLATQASRQTIASLAKTYQYLADLVAQGDRDALIKTFISTQDLWENKCL